MNSTQRRKQRIQQWTQAAPDSRLDRWVLLSWIAILQPVGESLRWLIQHIPGVKRPPQHLINGERGEDFVFWYLQREGWKVIARRWRSPREHGDIDLVALDGTTLCFIEVKTRSSRGMIPAHLAVDQSKRKMLRKMGRLYLHSIPRDLRPVRTRFDVIAVYIIPGEATSMEVHRNAFGWRERRRPSRSGDY